MTININEFRNVELRAGTVERVEEVKGSKHLYKLHVNLGNEKRQILSGIKKYYTPEELEGEQFIFVANLEHAKLMGEVSEGMILAATDKEKDVVVLIKPEKRVDDGTLLT